VNDTKHPATPTGNIPVLFDIVERGKYAPDENAIKPPPTGNAVFNLDDIEAGSECPTVLPNPPKSDADVTEFSLDDLEDDITEERPVIPPEMLETDSTEFNLDPTDAVTGEVPTIPQAMLEITKTQNEMVDQVMQKLMPHLEELALETVRRIVKENNEIPEKDKDQ